MAYADPELPQILGHGFSPSDGPVHAESHTPNIQLASLPTEDLARFVGRGNIQGLDALENGIVPLPVHQQFLDLINS